MIKIKTCFLLCCIFISNSYIPPVLAGIVITSRHGSNSQTTIYQNGFAVFVKNGKTNAIVDTKKNNCIVINHQIKQYLYIKCTTFNSLNTKRFLHQQQQSLKKMPLAQQKKIPENKIPKTPISVKRSGRGSYQGYHVEKFQFRVDNEVVSEYWMSAILEEKIKKEIDIEKVNKVFKIADKLKLFNNGLKSKIEKKYEQFRKKHFALKEFHYGDSGSQKIYRHVTIKQINIRDFLPPKSYKKSVSLAKYIKTER